MFGILALTVDQLLRFVNEPDLVFAHVAPQPS